MAHLILSARLLITTLSLILAHTHVRRISLLLTLSLGDSLRVGRGFRGAGAGVR